MEKPEQLGDYLERVAEIPYTGNPVLERDREYDELSEYRTELVSQDPAAAATLLEQIIYNPGSSPELQLEAVNCLVALARHKGFLAKAVQIAAGAIKHTRFENDAIEMLNSITERHIQTRRESTESE